MLMGLLRRADKDGRKYLNPVPTRVGGFDTVWKVLPEFLFGREERVPKRVLGPFRTDASVFGTAAASGLRITWMGHSTMVVEVDGVRVLVDPVWDERAGPVRFAGPKRFFDAPLKLEEMPEIDVVLVSHDHYDHLGKETVRRLSRMDAMKRARWVTSVGVGEILRGFGVGAERITELNWMDSVTVAGGGGAELKIAALAARAFFGGGLGDGFG